MVVRIAAGACDTEVVSPRRRVISMPRSTRTNLDDAAVAFGDVRPRLLGIAYRMLGSVSEAEDIVQDAWLRWQTYDRSKVESPVAFLSTTTTRLAINAVQSARARRETYIGPWLPEPVDTSADPALGAERGEALSFAVLLLLEKLSPTERAAYVLRESFEYPYRQIADTIEVSEANARQLVTRARKHIAAGSSASVSIEDHRRLLAAFVDAAQNGDLAGLTALFAEDVVSSSDGGVSRTFSRLVFRSKATCVSRNSSRHSRRTSGPPPRSRGCRPMVRPRSFLHARGFPTHC